MVFHNQRASPAKDTSRFGAALGLNSIMLCDTVGAEAG